MMNHNWLPNSQVSLILSYSLRQGLVKIGVHTCLSDMASLPLEQRCVKQLDVKESSSQWVQVAFGSY